jgi:hypothetical protein
MSINISGIWEDHAYRNTKKGTFSWGQNPYSTGSIIIDLDDSLPYLSCHAGGTFYISKIDNKKTMVKLTGTYSDSPDEEKEIIIHIIDENNVSIELVDRNPVWLGLRSDKKHIFHRVPVDAPYEPLGPNENI